MTDVKKQRTNNVGSRVNIFVLLQFSHAKVAWNASMVLATTSSEKAGWGGDTIAKLILVSSVCGGSSRLRKGIN